MTTSEIVIRVLVVISWLPAVAFPLLYGFRSRWRTTPAGRSLMTLSASMGVLLTLIVSAYLFGRDYPGQTQARIVAYGWLTYALWRLLWTLARAQRHERASDRS